MNGEIITLSNGHLSYEFYDGKPDDMTTIATVLETQFGFTIGQLIDGMDTYHIDCYKDEIRLAIGWDNWSGCFVMAFDEEGDKIIHSLTDIEPLC